MAQYGVMDNFEFRRAQAQYKTATDDVLGWLRSITNEPKETTSVSFHKVLAGNAKAAGVAMPQKVQHALGIAIQLRKQCKSHHIMLGSNDEGHNFILGELEQIQRIYDLEPTSATAPQRGSDPTPAFIPAPPARCMGSTFTTLTPSPPPGLPPTFITPTPSPPPYFPPTFDNGAWPTPIHTGYIELASARVVAGAHNFMHDYTGYSMCNGTYSMQQAMYPWWPHQSIEYDYSATQPMGGPATFQPIYHHVARRPSHAVAICPPPDVK